MKKLTILFTGLLLVAGLAQKVEAQTFLPVSTPTLAQGYFKASNGIVNASTGFISDTVSTALKAQTLPVSSYWDSFLVQVNLTKISGTAAGTVAMFGSLDGFTYPFPIGSSFTVTDKASQSAGFSVGATTYPYIEAVYTPTGTMSVKMTTIFYAKKRAPVTY